MKIFAVWEYSSATKPQEEKVGEEVLGALEDNTNMCFEDLDPKHYAYEVNENGLTVQYTTDSMGNLPSLKQMSKIIKEIFVETGIKY